MTEQLVILVAVAASLAGAHWAFRPPAPRRPPASSRALLWAGQLAVQFAEWAYDAAERARKLAEPQAALPPVASARAPPAPDVAFFELGLPAHEARAINTQLKWRMASTEGRARS